MTKFQTPKSKNIVIFLVLFELKIQKIVIFSLFVHPGASAPEPHPNKKVSEAENEARELKKLAPSP